jgi:hypothetical protein
MNKAQKITVAVVAIVEAIILLLHFDVEYYIYDDAPRLMLFVLFLGVGIWVLLGLKKKVK